MSGGLPTSPFEVEATKDIIQKHIDAGDIKQSDLDLLKRTYRWMSISSVVGSAGMALPTYFYLRNARPVRPIGIRLMVAGGMGMVGSFLGFTAGGVAAAMEVNRRMENPQDKMKIFHDIALEARQATIDRATGAAGTGIGNQRQRPIPGNPRPSSSNAPSPSSFPAASSSSAGMYDPPQAENVEAVGVQTSPSSWSSEAALDRQELERERARSVNTSSDRSGSGSMASPTKNEREAGSTAWDRLRKDAFPSTPQGTAAPAPRTRAAASAGAGDAERSREQAAFDALLEKERAGGEGDKWA